MESATIKMNYYDKIEIGREHFSGEDWFGYLLTLIMDVVSDNELSNEDTKELIVALSEELNNS